MSRTAAAVLVTFVAIVVGSVAYAAGLSAGRQAPAAASVQPPIAQPVQAPDPFQPPAFQNPQPFQGPQQFQAPQPFQVPAPGQPLPPGQTPNLREFIPIPGPGDQTPGQRPQQQQGECEPVILFYHNGQLYQLRPGQGPQDGQGRPGTPPEFFHLNPYQGPAIPGLPVPRPDRGPGFSPVNPRS